MADGPKCEKDGRTLDTRIKRGLPPKGEEPQGE